METKELKRIHIDNFYIAGFSYWDGCEAFEGLKIGKRLQLVREADNPFDPYAVAIYDDDFKLGFVPRGNNNDISKFLDMGWSNVYEMRIRRICPEEHPEQQVEVSLYVVRNDYCTNTYICTIILKYISFFGGPDA